MRFQSTRPRGARQYWLWRYPRFAMFQSTRPRGARRLAGDLTHWGSFVSIHAPAWGATRAIWSNKRFIPRFQSTRPRGARHNSLPACCTPVVAVSIHAPAWGATYLLTYLSYLRHVSIHAPAWGATGPSAVPRAVPPSRFNPRARVGRDRSRAEYKYKLDQFQSTRPRGARPYDNWTVPEVLRFQSTRPRGARQYWLWRYPRLAMFQSTRPRGARRIAWCIRR